LEAAVHVATAGEFIFGAAVNTAAIAINVPMIEKWRKVGTAVAAEGVTLNHGVLSFFYKKFFERTQKRFSVFKYPGGGRANLKSNFVFRFEVNSLSLSSRIGGLGRRWKKGDISLPPRLNRQGSTASTKRQNTE
jgi:hypothetical protein